MKASCTRCGIALIAETDPKLGAYGSEATTREGLLTKMHRLCPCCTGLLNVFLQRGCCVNCECKSDPYHLWFTIEIVTEDTQLHFCPAHALAAEVLCGLGLGAEQIVARLRNLESARHKSTPALHRARVPRGEGPQGAY